MLFSFFPPFFSSPFLSFSPLFSFFFSLFLLFSFSHPYRPIFCPYRTIFWSSPHYFLAFTALFSWEPGSQGSQAFSMCVIDNLPNGYSHLKSEKLVECREGGGGNESPHIILLLCRRGAPLSVSYPIL